jgi:hypothetical protein
MTTLTSKAVRFITAAALGLGLLWSAPSRGAPPNTIGNSVAVCDPWNPQRCAQPDASGNMPITGSFSAAGFTPAATGTPISVTTGGVTGTLPAGAVVAAFNVGTTNTAYCKLGASATTSDIAIPPASWFAFTVGAATQLTCITASSTTTVNMVGGTGLPTGAGGGGGGGGGAVTMADGANVTQGAITDAASTVGGTGTLSAKLRFITTQLDNINTSVQAAIPAGTNLIGDVNLRQGGTALSTTNGAYFNQLQGNTALSATNPTFAAPIPTTSGGLSVYFLQPTASTNSNNIKNAAGQVYKIDVFNNSATVHYIRLYNTATTGTCNSATNLVWQGIIPASTSGAGLSSSWDLGMAFSSGVALCVTSGYDGTGNATASALIVNVGYK